MDDLEQEWQSLLKQQAELNAKIEAKNRKEYSRLLLAILPIVVLQVIATLNLSSTNLDLNWAAIVWSVTVIAFVASALTFYKNAAKSAIGVKAYLKNEGALMVEEIPNILQILSVLGFLAVFLRQTIVKFAVTAIITVLLLVYLTSKRNKSAYLNRNLRDKVTRDVTVPLSLTIGLVFASLVYGLASLVAKQL